MKQFSDALEKERQFEIGGELFKWRYPYWEEMSALFDEDSVLLEKLKENGNEEFSTDKEAIELIIKRIELFLDPEEGSLARWKKLAHRKSNPVPRFQFNELYRWLLEVTSGRPTEQPSDLEPGAGSTEASSVERSP
jgi:hypothetical protein